MSFFYDRQFKHRISVTSIRNSNGFTLVELVIVVAIIAILAVVALPSYYDFVTRTKLTEGFSRAAQAKLIVAENYNPTSNVQLLARANQFNLSDGSAITKFIRSVQIDPPTGEITILSNNANLQLSAQNSSIILTPQINVAGVYTLLNNNPAPSGTIDWGCISATNTFSTSRGMQTINLGTMPPQFVSVECR